MNVVDSEQVRETDAIEIVTEPGKIYVVLGDSIPLRATTL